MRFEPLPISGAYRIELEPHADERGFFARIFSREEFLAHGLAADFVQWSLSFTPRVGTLRGLHFQLPPHQETKLVRCVRGRIYDVLVDLRQNSPTYLQHTAWELCADSRSALYIPPGCAHGFLTLTPDCEIHYAMDVAYHPESASGVRFDDPAFKIHWPLPVELVSARDRSWPLWDPSASPF
jgi:dTDP-4-dehydrorhamnose 3,5-epimerase